MIDCFALLDEPRRPWLDEELLKAKFLQLSGETHPDRVHQAGEEQKREAGQRFAELNAAYQCLREPKTRLSHLFELESGAKPKEVQQIPPETMDLFLEVSSLCRGADAHLEQRATLSSPVLKAQMFETGLEWTERLQALQRHLNTKRIGLIDALKDMTASWQNAPSAGAARIDALPLEELERLGREFSYLDRWAGQIQERIVQMSF